MTVRNYIGLACTGHDNAIAIVDDAGEVLFAEGTERALQSKRAISASPDDPVRIGSLVEQYCDPEADLVVARSWSDQAGAVLQAELDATPRAFSAYRYVLSVVGESVQRPTLHLPHRYRYGEGMGKTRRVEERAYDHHLTHAATACFSSTLEDAVCLVIDGFGEGSSLGAFQYRDGAIDRIDVEPTPMNASLGMLYDAACDLCGFDHWKGEQWKVMGLAPYGKRSEEAYEILRSMLQVKGLSLERGTWARSAAALHELTTGDAPKVKTEDLAHTAQLVFSELVIELCRNLHERVPSKALVLGGGCALNSSCNGELVEATPFEELFVFSAPADDGNAVGAALLAHREDRDAQRRSAICSPYLGSELSEETLERAERFDKIPSLVRHDDVEERTADLLAEGRILGWAQGRAEFGPRALGNRSILADPRRADMKDRINALVKFREAFRPFAPSILHEFGDEYFEAYQESPYMERTLRFRPEVRDRIPAVVHVNGTGRLQTVREEWNPRYYRLIRAFYERTGVPMVLNTSLNIMGKPIIHSVEDALALFYTTGLEALVVGDCVIEATARD